MTYLEKAADLQNQLAQGKVMEAFEQYYADNVRVTEVPTNEVREGKDAQREAIKQWMDSVQEEHDGGILSITSNEDQGITTVESWMDVTFKDGNRGKMTEVAVQKWKGDQIVDEKFYYNDSMAGMNQQ